MLKELLATTSDSSSSEHNCGGCGSAIKDRFYLLAADRAWHGTCLRCSQCFQPLDAELTCFAREGNIYCKDDYYRIFSSHRCSRCGTGLCSSELVMRAREFVFHISCFSCSLCGSQLSTGDTAVLREGRIFCSEHCDDDIISDVTQDSTTFYTNSPHKGRPRKRKTVNSHHRSESPSNNQSSTTIRIDLNQSELTLSSLDLSYDGSQSPGSISGGGSSSNMTNHSRSKRMRTSFKHHQLRTMKSYFAINQNPDAKDLKQLAQKTGLSKRVLQVWFQNARAKWRRNVMRQDNGTSTSINHMSGNITSISGVSSGSESNTNLQSSSCNSNLETNSSHGLDEMHHMTFSELY